MTHGCERLKEGDLNMNLINYAEDFFRPFKKEKYNFSIPCELRFVINPNVTFCCRHREGKIRSSD